MLSVPPHMGASLAPSPVVPWHDLLPLCPPPPSTRTTAAAPPHPPRPNVDPPEGYVRSLHASPGAWPRSFKEGKGNYDRLSQPYWTETSTTDDKNERAARIERAKIVCGEAPKLAHEWDIEDAMSDPNPGHPQWVPVERWRRKEPVEGGITLLFMHANGMPKEDYHPVIRQFLSSSNASTAFGTGTPLAATPNVVVNDIFLMEDTLHGVGQDLNAGHLPSIHAWADLARDILNFIVHVLPSMADNAPWQLEWHQNPEESAKRTIFGIGHSLGGNALVHASFTRPDAFEALLLIDPMTQPTGANSSKKMGYPVQALTLKRRFAWSSFAEAAELNRPNPMFSKFDPETFEQWLKFGLVSTSDGVMLATPPWAEACVFSDPRAPQRGWDLLPQVQVPVGFLMAEDTRWMGGPKIQRELVWRPPRARNEMVKGAGHLVVQERPYETAKALSRFLATVKAGVWDDQRSKL